MSRAIAKQCAFELGLLAGTSIEGGYRLNVSTCGAHLIGMVVEEEIDLELQAITYLESNQVEKAWQVLLRRK